ncbi:MAG: hypothetical protein LBE80_04070 [Deltaproteobacteria bacterium]|jgi:hypothetical protein|nr:hypothetical protein [Deltaproteobacteria bacterium]
MKRTLLCLTVLLTLLLANLFQADLATAQSQLISKLLNDVEEYVKVRYRFLSADDKDSWVPFVDSDKTKARKELDSYLNDALSVLLNDQVIKIKDDIKALYKKNRDLEVEITDINFKKIDSPSGKKFYEVWKNTTNDIDDKISDRRNQIRKNRLLIDKYMDDIVRQLAAGKVTLSKEQVHNIFISNGEDQLNAIVVLKNLYAICDILKQSIAQSNDINVNKKYYGVFLLATDAHKKQLETNLVKIDEIYLPKLLELQKNNQALMETTRSLAQNNPQYENNLIAQRQTQEVAEKFKVLLQNQATIVMERLEALEDIILYAENTYATVDLASSLANSMDQSVNDLQELLNMPVIPPLTFENSLEDKFLEISQKLASN